MRTCHAINFGDAKLNNLYEKLDYNYLKYPKISRIMGLGVALIDTCARPLINLADIIESIVCVIRNAIGKCSGNSNATLDDFVLSIEDTLKATANVFISVTFSPIKFVYQAYKIQVDLPDAQRYKYENPDE